MYERTVRAALTDTHSKLTLANALALDIPADPAALGGQPVTVHLKEAQKKIIMAGGEPRDISTLAAYRETALWVEAPPGRKEGEPRFRWLPRVSFGAHNEARRAGMTYEDFAKLPKPSVVAVREATGRDGYSWGSPGHKVDTTRAALTNPDIAGKVMEDPMARAAVLAAMRPHVDAEMGGGRPEPPPGHAHRPVPERPEMAVEAMKRALGAVVLYGAKLARLPLASETRTELAARAERAGLVIDWLKAGDAGTVDEALAGLFRETDHA